MRTISAMQVEEDVDCKTMAVLEFKKREMEQQVEILRLKRTCQWARRDIG
jgi:huntingtin-interacting protein 1-related protein